MCQKQLEYVSTYINENEIIKTKKYKNLVKNISNLKKEIETLKKMELEERKKFKIACAGCGNKEKFKRIDFIQSHFYEEPCGCSGGDYYVADEIIFVCSKCKCKNRFLSNNKKEHVFTPITYNFYGGYELKKIVR